MAANKLDATDEQIEFPILYTNAKTGLAKTQLNENSANLQPLFDAILTKVPGPTADDEHIPQFLVTNLDYDPYVGQVAIGRLNNGILAVNKQAPNK